MAHGSLPSCWRPWAVLTRAHSAWASGHKVEWALRTWASAGDLGECGPHVHSSAHLTQGPCGRALPTQLSGRVTTQSCCLTSATLLARGLCRWRGRAAAHSAARHGCRVHPGGKSLLSLLKNVSLRTGYNYLLFLHSTPCPKFLVGLWPQEESPGYSMLAAPGPEVGHREGPQDLAPICLPSYCLNPKALHVILPLYAT